MIEATVAAPGEDPEPAPSLASLRRRYQEVVDAVYNSDAHVVERRRELLWMMQYVEDRAAALFLESLA